MKKKEKVYAKFSPPEQQRLLDYLDAHLSYSLRNDELAAQLNLSVRQFHGQFVATFGLAPHKFVMQLRVARVQELINAGRASPKPHKNADSPT